MEEASSLLLTPRARLRLPLKDNPESQGRMAEKS
jgi:hypothetical protein